MKKTVTHPRFGQITVSRSRRSRRITLSVRPPHQIRLSLPPLCTLKSGMAFLESRADWIEATLSRIAQQFPHRIIEPPYSTISHTLILSPGEHNQITARVTRDKITVAYPASMSHTDDAVQEVIRKAATRALRTEAEAVLPEMVKQMAEKHGFRYGKVTIRTTTSRWGSCSARDDISLSTYLALLPRHLIEYVIAHELCHTLHKNHSAAFHAAVDRVLSGKEKELAAELRKYRPQI